MPTKSPVAPDYTWDERAGRYRSSDGRFVSRQTITAACEKTIQAAGENIDRLANELRAGNITLAEWQTQMQREIKTVHVANAAAARGGWAQMSQSDWGYVGSLVKKELKWLDNFAAEIQSGKQPLNGRLNVRAQQYARAGRSTYDQMRTRWQKNSNNMEEEALILGNAEHCDECLFDAKLGYVPIGTLRPIGSRKCRRNCQCHKKYRRMGANGQYITAEG